MTAAAPSPAPVDPDDEGGIDRSPTRISRWQKAVGAAGLVVVVWVGYDSTLVRAWFDDSAPAGHMPDSMDHGTDGDMPDGMDHGTDGDAPPPGGSPEGNQDPDIEPGVTEHDPSQWDH